MTDIRPYYKESYLGGRVPPRFIELKHFKYQLPNTILGFNADGVATLLQAGTNITITGGVISASGGGSGSVTSVALSVPTGFSVSGSPVTTSGTLALSFSAGYSLPTTAKQTDWDTAFGWGNHASAGYQVVLKDAEAFDKEFSVIQEQYADVISSREQQLKEYSELLQQENDIQLKKIDISWIPEDIETKDMNVLYPLIEE